MRSQWPTTMPRDIESTPRPTPMGIWRERQRGLSWVLDAMLYNQKGVPIYEVGHFRLLLGWREQRRACKLFSVLVLSKLYTSPIGVLVAYFVGATNYACKLFQLVPCSVSPPKDTLFVPINYPVGWLRVICNGPTFLHISMCYEMRYRAYCHIYVCITHAVTLL